MRRAFTLIELLVVIAIIAILAAILFPVFAQAKEAAKKTACLSSTKQMALGVYLYTSDSEDTMCQTSYEQGPAGSQNYNPANPNGTYQIHWSFLIQPYIKNWNLFVCPSDPTPTPTDAVCTNGYAEVGTLTGGLMTCDWAAQKSSYIPVYNVMPAHDWTVVSLGQIDTPANQIMITEHRNDNVPADGHKGTSGFFPSQPCPNWALVPYPAGANQYSYFPEAVAKAELAAASPNYAANKSLFKKYDIIRVAFDRHTGGQNANYCFADGHAKNQAVGKTLDPNNYEYGSKWYPTSQPWNTSPCN